MKRHDVIVIGAGPAGLAAAATAAAAGLDVLLLDEQPGPGGQVHRAAESAPLPWIAAKAAAARQLAKEARGAGATLRLGASVWAATRELMVAWEGDGGAGSAGARALILATGARERVLPFPGWTLPGVMAAGAAQIALKEAGLGADGAVLAGSGPLLHLLAAQYLRAGFRPAAILETTPRGAWRRAARHLPHALLGGGGTLLQGIGLIARPHLAGVPHRRGVTLLRAEGAARLEQVRFRHRGEEHSIATPHLFVHHGVVPQTVIAAALGCPLAWSEGGAAWQPAADGWGATPIAGVFVAGDGAGIGGAAAAVPRGRLAGLAAAAALGGMAPAERDARAAPERAVLARAMAVRPLLDALYAPDPRAMAALPDDVLLCRCEEVSAGAIRAALRGRQVAAADANALKSLTRAGMGSCQGRSCGAALCALIAAERDCAERDVPPLRPRLPLKPVSSRALAELHG